jgi:hypothetical protein
MTILPISIQATPRRQAGASALHRMFATALAFLLAFPAPAGVGMDADTDWAHRAVNIGQVGHTDFGVGLWHYRTSAGQSYSTITEAGIVGVGHGSNGREVFLGFNNRFDSGAITDPYLAIGDSQTGLAAFDGADQPPFDTWFYIYLRGWDNGGTRTLTAEWSTDCSTWHSQSKANGVEGSVQAEQVLLGRRGVGDANTSNGWYAYLQVYGTDIGQSALRSACSKSASATSELGFWPLVDNTDTGDDSGNGNTITFNGTLSTEASPTLSTSGCRLCLIMQQMN